jgi:hypothetical protein
LADVGHEVRRHECIGRPVEFEFDERLALGEGPEIVVPPVPTAMGSGTPWTYPSVVAFADSRATTAAAASGRTWMLSTITCVRSWLLNVVVTPG